MAIKGLFTTSGINKIIETQNNEGFLILADKFGISDVATVPFDSNIVNANAGQWFQAVVSSRTRINSRTVKVSCTIPPGASPGLKNINEIYIYGKDPANNSFVMAVGQPTNTIQYDPSNTTTLELQISLVDVDLTANYIFNNTFPVELSEHNTSPTSHPEIPLALKKAGIFIPMGAYPFKYEGQGFDEFPKFDGTKSSVVYGGITFTAERNGTELNGAQLVFDGVKTVAAVVAAYGVANPTKPAILFTGAGTVVPVAGTTTLVGGTYNVIDRGPVYMDVDGIYKKAIADGSIKSKVAGIAFIAERAVKASGFLGINTGFAAGADLYLSSTVAGTMVTVSTPVKLGTQIGSQLILIGGTGGSAGSSTANGFDAVVSDTPAFGNYPTTQEAINAVGNGGRILINKLEAVQTTIVTNGKSLNFTFAHPKTTGWFKYAGTQQTVLVTFNSVPTSGTWRLELGSIAASESVDLPFNANAAAVQAAFLAMVGVPAGSTVTGDYTVGFTFTFGGNSNYPLLNFSDPGINEIQTVNFSAIPNDGTFRLSHNGNLSANIAWNDTPSEVLAQILAINGITSGVLSGSIATGSFTFEFTGASGKQNQPTFLINNNSLTGGGTPVTPSVVVTQDGKYPGNNLKVGANPAVINVQQLIGGTPVGPNTCIQVSKDNTSFEGYGIIQNFLNGIDLNNMAGVKCEVDFSSTTHPFINYNIASADYDIRRSFGFGKQKLYVVGSNAVPGDFNNIVDALGVAQAGDKLLVTANQTISASLSISANIEIEFVNGSKILATNATSPILILSGAVVTKNLHLHLQQAASFQEGIRFSGSGGHHTNIVVETVAGATISSAYVLHTDAESVHITGKVLRSGGTITSALLNNSANISHDVRIRDGNVGSLITLESQANLPKASPIRMMGGGEWKLTPDSLTLSWSGNAFVQYPGVPDANNVLAPNSVNLQDGEVVAVEMGSIIQFTGVRSNGSNIISGIGVTSKLLVGMTVSGPNIPASSVITAVNLNSIQINNNATLSGSGEFIASKVTALVPQVFNPTTLIPTVNTLIIAKRSGDTVYIGINGNEMVLRPGEFKDLHGSGYFVTVEGVAGESLVAGDTVYLSIGASDGGRTANRLYKLDTSQSFQVMRSQFLGTITKNVLAGENVRIVYSGKIKKIGLTAGATYFADPLNPGKIIVGKPDTGKAIQVGVAVNSTDLIVNAVGSGANELLSAFFGDMNFGSGLSGQSSFILNAIPIGKEGMFPSLNGRFLDHSEFNLEPPKTLKLNSPIAESASQLQIKYILAGQASLSSFACNAVDTGNNKKFSINFTPKDYDSTFVLVDGGRFEDAYNIIIDPVNGSFVEFSSVIGAGRNVFVFGFNAQGASRAGVTSLIAGSGISIANLGGGSYQISAPSVSGGYVLPVGPGGSEANAANITASGLTPMPGIQRQMWFVKTLGGLVNVTGVPQIAPGTIIGQELLVVGVSDVNYPIFTDGNGLKLNGSISMNAIQSLKLVWTGTVWREEAARVM